MSDKASFEQFEKRAAMAEHMVESLTKKLTEVEAQFSM
jgi:hypothetical protein